MTGRLALGIVPGIGWRAREIETVAREAEDAREIVDRAARYLRPYSAVEVVNRTGLTDHPRVVHGPISSLINCA